MATEITGSGNFMASRMMGWLGIAEGVPGPDVLEADGRRDVPGEDLVPLLPLVGVHLEDPANPLLPLLGGVQHVGAGGDGAGIDPEEGELPHIGVGHDLEGQGAEGRVVVGLPDLPGFVFMGQVPLDRGNVERRRKVVDDAVQKGLNALVLEGGPAEDREDLTGDGSLPNGPPELVLGGLLTTQVFLQELVVMLDRGFNQLVSKIVHLLLQGVGNVGSR